MTNFNSRPYARGDAKCRVVSCRICLISIHAPTRGATIIPAWGNSVKVQFQFTPLREGRLTALRFNGTMPNRFQFTPLREGRRGLGAHPQRNTSDFNSRPYARGDRHTGHSGAHRSHNFNSRPYARGDRFKTKWNPGGRIFQFTPLREGRQEITGVAERSRRISIHAPTRGATGTIHAIDIVNTISIHAPTRGATLIYPGAVCRGVQFQFTPLREGRQIPAGFPGGGALQFQFTPLREGRPTLTITYEITPEQFQFTPLREGRLVAFAEQVNKHLFQFTPLREGRREKRHVCRRRRISIHAPTRGATAGF